MNTIRPLFKDAIEEGCLSALFAGTSPRVVEDNLRGEYIYPPDEVTSSSNQAKDEELGGQLITLSDTLVKQVLV